MRLFLLLALSLAASAQDAAYRGFLIVRSEARPLAGAEGTETQEEKIEFLLVTEPLAKGESRQPFRMRERSGSYGFALDWRDSGVTTKAGGAGDLHPEVTGSVDPRTGDVQLEVSVTPRRIVVKTTMAGFEQGRFRTYRTVTERKSLADGFAVQGKLDVEGVAGATLTDQNRKERHPRTVETTWRIERIDPSLRGLAVDPHGNPLAGLRVVARTTDPERLRRRLPPIEREGVTDERGRFRIEAPPGRWEIEIEGALRGEHVIEGRVFREGVLLKIDDAPFTDASLSVYRISALPESRALRSHFKNDLKGYFAYIRERVREERLAAALVAPPGE